jgi:[acyl-carrier-protein] S-malonyltransferase
LSEVKKVAYIFPGQGSQIVGMGKDLYDSYESVKALFKQADEAAGFGLTKLCFEGPEEELRQTINAQPALVTASIACLTAAREVAGGKGLPLPAFMAGHSLGEYTAMVAAGVVDFRAGVYLARERGRLMQEAGLKQRGSMAAVLGLEESILAEICQQTETTIANINCPGQLVISGASEKVAKASELAKAKGAARVVPLQVSAAFHSPLMQPAVDGMADILSKVNFRDPAVPIIANTTAQPLTSAAQFQAELLRQLTNPVQWQRSVEYMVGQGVKSFIEFGPGKVLTGLVRRITKDAETINVSDAAAVKSLGNV